MTNDTDPASPTVQEWIAAVLAVANAEGMRNDQVIPTWPADLPHSVACSYPALTIGALRKWDLQQAASGKVMAWMDADGEVISAEKKLRMMTNQGAAGVEIASKYCRPLTDPGASNDWIQVIEGNCWDLRCTSEPTGGDDCDVLWHVIEHHMAEPHERTLASNLCPIKALERALSEG